MCGISGYSCYKKEYDPRLNLTICLLGLYMQERGRRSWGWTDGEQLVKSTGSFEHGWNGSFYQGFMQAMLHTRQPTVGEVNEENSHPFKIGEIIGVHNGVVYNHTDLNKKYDRKCEVDSQHIFHHLNDGLDLSEIEAYGAIAFFRDGAIHLGRFNNGDLSLAKTDTAWVFASTKTALENALRLSGFGKGTVYFKLKEGRLYQIKDDNLVREDLKLNFSRSTSSRTWQSGYETSSYTDDSWEDIIGEGGRVVGRRWKTPSDGSHSHYGTQYSGNSSSSTDKKESDSTTENKTVESIPDVRYKSTDEKIKDLLLAAAERQASQGDAVSSKIFNCGYCGVVLEDGDTYYITTNGELLCEGCGEGEPTDLVGQGTPHKSLPSDIFRVEAFAADLDVDTIECDECDEKFHKEDIAVHTKDGDFLCLQCFDNTALNEEIEDLIAKYEEVKDSETAEEVAVSQPEEKSKERKPRPLTCRKCGNDLAGQVLILQRGGLVCCEPCALGNPPQNRLLLPSSPEEKVEAKEDDRQKAIDKLIDAEHEKAWGRDDEGTEAAAHVLPFPLLNSTHRVQ